MTEAERRGPDGPPEIASLKSVNRASLGLAVAAVTLVVPLVVVVALYINGLNRELGQLDKQRASLRILQQAIALQINLADDYFSRFYSVQAGPAERGVSVQDIDNGTRSLMQTQLTAMDRDLAELSGAPVHAWQPMRRQFEALGVAAGWSEHLRQWESLVAAEKRFFEHLLLVSNLNLSEDEFERALSHLLFVDLNLLKQDVFLAAERSAHAVLGPPAQWDEAVYQRLVRRLGQVRTLVLNEQLQNKLQQQAGLSTDTMNSLVQVRPLVERLARLLEKKRRLVFLQAQDEMGTELTLEAQSLRAEVRDLIKNCDRAQTQIARTLDQRLSEGYQTRTRWRLLTIGVVASMMAFAILLGVFIARNIRLTQTYLRRQNQRLEAKVQARTEEIEQAKNEAEQLNQILGKQTRISTELARKAELASDAKSLFLASMSHEIRTPLNAVIGGAAILAKSSLDAHQRDILQLITQSGKTLLELINEILDFSKIEAGQLTLERLDVDVEQLVLDVVAMFSMRAREQGVRLSYVVDARCEGLWRGDPLRIKQIMMNLVSNAVKFTPMGSIRLLVQRDVKQQLEISVVDTGIGIRADLLSQLFEPFVQSDSSTTRRYGGTGLGLSICRRLAQMHGGDIQVDSSLGKGSVFRVSLPLARSGESSESVPRQNVRIALLTESADLQKQLLQWYQQVDRYQSLSALVQSCGELDSDTPAVAIVDSEALTRDATQWLSGHLSQGRRGLGLPWVLLTDQVSLGAGLSEALAQRLKTLGATVQLPLYSQGRMVRRAIQYALDNPDCKGESWLAQAKVSTVQKFRGRVLLVEDVEFNRIVASEILSALGLSVELAENGAEAIALMAQYYRQMDQHREPIGLVLMDLHMPEMNGLDATRAIRALERDARLPPIPIVALTADVLPETREAAVKSGMNGLLSKPFEEDELIAVLDTHLHADSESPAPSPARSVPSETLGQESSTQIFDSQLLVRRLRGREDRARDLAASLRSKLPGYTADLERASATGDATQLVFVAHTMKGLAGNLGAGEVQQLAAHCEQLGKAALAADEGTDSTELTRHGQALCESMVRLGQAIDRYLAASG